MSTIRSRTLLEPVPFSNQRWVWPLATIDGRMPSILESPVEYSAAGAVLIGYQATTSMTGLVPIFAAQAGVVVYAQHSSKSCSLQLEHAGGWATQYECVEQMTMLTTDRFLGRRKAKLAAGDVVGYCRPATAIRFSVSKMVDDGWAPIDPGQLMNRWAMNDWSSVPFRPRTIRPRRGVS